MLVGSQIARTIFVDSISLYFVLVYSYYCFTLTEILKKVFLANWKVEKETDCCLNLLNFIPLIFIPPTEVVDTTLEPWQNFSQEIGW